MNKEKYLVLIGGEDRTEEILKYDKLPNYIIGVYYNNNTKKMYPCSKRNFEFYKDPVEIDIEKQTITMDGSNVYNLEKVLRFPKHYKLLFSNGTSRTVESVRIELSKKETSNLQQTDEFEYLKAISEIVSIKTEYGKALLTNEYKKINFIEDDTALYRYLKPNTFENQSNKKRMAMLYPFGANKSQLEAVKKAMENQISIIEGPPGTGKTQTILNIIANIVKNNQTVAIVSNNNTAIDNVYEKLQKYGLDYLCAQLGKKENKEEFIKKQTGKYPEFTVNLENRQEIEEQIKQLNEDIMEEFILKNNIAKLKEELNQIKTEYAYFNKQEENNVQNIPKIRNINRVSSDKIMLLKVECEELEAKNQKINFWFKFKSRMLYGIGKNDFYKNNIEDLIKYFNKLYFMIKEIEINRAIKNNNRKLKFFGNDKLELLTINSMNLLKDFLRRKYNGEKERKILKEEDLYTNPQMVNEEYPIVLSTTHSIKNCFNANYKFDYIIMDEASQVDLITGALALSAARNAVIVGDLKQLPNVITKENQDEIKRISKQYEIGKPYDYLSNSFLSSISKAIEKAPRTLLKEHYRCHPRIIGFCNKKFYDDQLIIMTEDKGETDVLKAYVTVEGNHARGHINQRQIDVIKEEILPEIEKKLRRAI